VQYVSVVYVRSAVCVSGLCEKCSMCQWFMWEVQYVSVVYVRSSVCVSGLCEKCSMCQWFITVTKGYKEAYTIMTSYLNSIFLIHRF